MNFIEVFNEADRDKLLEMNFKLIKSVEVYGGKKYTFANHTEKHLTFSDIKVRFTNILHY